MKIEVDVHLNYHVPVPCWVLVQLEVAPLPSQNVLRQSLVVANQSEVDRVPADDAVGDRFWVKAEGDLVCSYQAALEVTRTSSDIRTMAASPLQQLPAEAIKYLLPSRYCPLEPFDAFLDEQFGCLSGGARVAAMATWLHENLSYDNGSSDGSTTAAETFAQLRGVCRDYAHLLISLARASAIPARYASVYSPQANPMDFHAVAEVFLDGQWHLVDPTRMSTPEQTIVIGVGRDATDVSFLTSYGELQFVSQSVQVQVVD